MPEHALKRTHLSVPLVVPHWDRWDGESKYRHARSAHQMQIPAGSISLTSLGLYLQCTSLRTPTRRRSTRLI